MGPVIGPTERGLPTMPTPVGDRGLDVAFHVCANEEVPHGVDLVEGSWHADATPVTRQVRRTPVGHISAT